MKALSWSIARGLAGFLGVFSVLNCLGDWLMPGFDASGWWLNVSWFPRVFVWFGLLITASLLGALALSPRLGPRRRGFTLAWLGALMICSLISCVEFFLVLSEGQVIAQHPVPVSALVLLGLGFISWRVYRNDYEPARWSGARAGLAAALVAVLFPVAQMLLFGNTNYERSADAVVVFGARVYPNGTPSLALADRVRTASLLVASGRAKWLVVSGGPGDRGTHETIAMRRMAIELGVPKERILVDRRGLTTQNTVKNSLTLLDQVGARRVLAVSHFYHLPRIKLAYQREGLQVYTVPAEETRRLKKMPWFVTREVAALWVYYLSPLT